MAEFREYAYMFPEKVTREKVRRHYARAKRKIPELAEMRVMFMNQGWIATNDERKSGWRNP